MVSNIYLEDKKKLIKTYVWRVALHGCEAWTVGKRERRRLKAFEISYYRKLLKVSRIDKVTNEEVSNLVKEKRILYANIKRRRDRLIRHILRHEGLTGIILEGTVEGRKRKGRKRLEYVKLITDDAGCSGYCEMKTRSG